MEFSNGLSAAAPTHQRVWTEAALKETVVNALHGRQVIVAANREPSVHEFDRDGSVRIARPAGGLVTALEPVMRACGGVWVAHGSGSADRFTADQHGRLRIACGGSSYRLRRVWLSAAEERGYYQGFANEGLWPLCHLAFTAPVFRRSDWEHYERVNQRFADAVADELTGDEPIVLVQDYHLALVPRFLRKRCPRAVIVAFWHIPWPNADRFARCPYGDALVRGLLTSDVVAFQTPRHERNFIESATRLKSVATGDTDGPLLHRGGKTHVRVRPISVEWPSRELATTPSVRACRDAVRRECGVDPDTPIVLAVDRLDYTKGIDERLGAIERFLARSARPQIAFVQLAAPSRTTIRGYQEYADRIVRRVSDINTRFGNAARPPVVYVHRCVGSDEVFRYYRAADVCWVGSLDDGMNLVSKEFVAARDDERGVLVLSEFAGAARELGEALIVNPFDPDGVVDALDAALAMSAGEQRRRMAAMRARVARANVYRWAAHLLMDAVHCRDESCCPPSRSSAAAISVSTCRAVSTA